MKVLNKIIFTLIFAFIIQVSFVCAQDALTIGDKSYDENTGVFTVTGTSVYDDVMVSLFDGDDLLSFKTVSPNNENYTVTFNILFDEDKEVTIKVGDIDSSNYKISKLNVKKSTILTKTNKLIDDDGNSLKILNNLKKFKLNDKLYIEVINDPEELTEEEKNIWNFIIKKLGLKKQMVGIMIIRVLDGYNDEVELDDIEDGYELFLNVEKEDLSGFKKPCMARILDDVEMEFEEGRELIYDTDSKGVVVKLNNIGLYVLYDDITIHYDFLDNTANPVYNLKKGNDLTLRIDADFDKFLDVYVDDKKVDKKNYTAKSGSTIITLKKSYVETLSTGSHEIKVDFTDGEAITTLKISDASNPSTGDKIIKYVIALFVSFTGTLVGIKYLRKRFCR